MKKAITIISVIWLALNIIFGLMISSYGWLNVTASSGIIIITLILCLLAGKVTVKDGFKVSLLISLIIIGFIQYLLAVFMAPVFTDNWCLIAIFILLGIESVLLVSASITSKRFK